jgi:protein involved in polysaccharide export with SLBB domain
MDKKASTTLPGTVDKILKPPAPGEREQAQIAVEGADSIYKDIRIENALTDDLGHEVRLEPGDKVKVTITSEPEPIRFGKN